MRLPVLGRSRAGRWDLGQCPDKQGVKPTEKSSVGQSDTVFLCLLGGQAVPKKTEYDMSVIHYVVIYYSIV